MAYNPNNRGVEKLEPPKLLPYDFIPFPDKWEYPYEEYFGQKGRENLNELPKHDKITGLCGSIDYRMDAQTDLAMDFRKIDDTNYQVSGSTMRGKIRSNLEILSASYPVFIDRVVLSYRDIAGNMSKQYMKKLKGGSDGDIARNINVGFLKKEGNSFYIEPAAQIGSLNFKSVFEDELVESIGLVAFSNLFNWNAKGKSEIKKKRTIVNELTQKIENTKRKYKAMDEKSKERIIFEEISKQRDNIFKTEAKFTRRFKKYKVDNENKRNQAINTLCKDIEFKLKKINLKGLDLSDFHNNYVKRIGLKAEIYIDYMFMYKNDRFQPYQKEIKYGKNKFGSFEVRKPNAELKEQNEEVFQKGYLYNSTNASSKKSHYLIAKTCEMEDIEISQALVFSYNESLKNFKVSQARENDAKNKGQIEKYQETIKAFYDIFDNYDDLLRANPEGPIVFYRLDEGGLKDISRTPYLRVSYEHQIENLINSKSDNLSKDTLSIDYARALFGYVANDFYYEYGTDKINEIQSYKSRLRFLPLEIKTTEKDALNRVDNFTLLSPLPSACGMYLDQTNTVKVKTYEDADIELNGYKYYKMTENNMKPDVNASESYKCSKIALDKNKIKSIKGSISFENLTEEELGLLILSLDINQLKNKEWIQLRDTEYFDSIGGAKPYGYGCVRINIDKINLKSTELNPQDIEYWIDKKETDSFEKYIAAAFEKKVIPEETLSFYLTSKQKKKIDSSINWENLSSKIKIIKKNNGAGYPKEWILGKQSGMKIAIDYKKVEDLLNEIH